MVDAQQHRGSRRIRPATYRIVLSNHPASRPFTVTGPASKPHARSGRRIRVREAPRRGYARREAPPPNPVPTASFLALAGGVVAALIVRRRIAVTTVARARSRWVFASFER